MALAEGMPVEVFPCPKCDGLSEGGPCRDRRGGRQREEPHPERVALAESANWQEYMWPIVFAGEDDV